jgi:hypothetical protein
MEGNIEGTRRRGTRFKQILDVFEEKEDTLN